MATIRILGRRAALAALAAAWTATAFAAPPPAPASAASTAPAPLSGPGVLMDEVVAVVNDQPILESTLDEEMTRVSATLRAQGTALPPENVFRHQVLEHLITQSLQLQAANQQGIQVSDDQVNQALSQIAKSHNIALAELPQALAAQGENYTAFRTMVRNQLIVHQLIQQAVAANIEVSPAEINQYLLNENRAQSGSIEYHIAQILVAFPDNPTPQQAKETQAKAQAIEARLKGGADFASTAVAQSAGPHALEGGNIGWLKGADLPTFFADVVPAMKPGDISQPIEAVGGYHIVKLVATRKPDSANLATEYNVKHILISPNPVRNSNQAKALAEKLRAEIASGKTSFAAAAKEYSGDPNSAGSGGELGWITPDALPKPLAAVLPSLALNALSQPLQTAYGWDLMEVTGTRRHDVSQTDRQNAAYQAIFQRKLADQVPQFTRTLRGQAYVHIINPADAGGAATSPGAEAAGG